MRKHLISTIFLLMTLSNYINAQKRNCGTMQHLSVLQAADPLLDGRMQEIERHTERVLAQRPAGPISSAATVVTIPVVFHIVYSNSTQNISDSKCIEQLNQLNLDFARLNADASKTPSAFLGVAADTKIQFCLAQRDPSGNPTNGIIRKSTSTTSFSSDDKVKSSSTGGDNAWPSANYLNIWSCNLSNGLLGYAQFPGGSASTDGIVLLFSSIGSVASPGTAAPYNLGRTATHEVGHWLNLRHIWGDANCGSDLVGDTPTQQTSNGGCPAFPKVTCSNGPNGDMFMNYMDYTDDGCMNMFTAGQATRMNALFASGGARASLLTSLGCQAPNISACNLASGLAASNVSTTGATLGWTSVSGASRYNVQYRVAGSSSWTAINSTTNTIAINGLNAATNYEFQVQTVCSGSSSAFTTSATFTTLSSSTTCSDVYESNNTSAAAKTISVNTAINALIDNVNDVDWYSFTTTSPNSNVKISLNAPPADYDISLYNSAFTLLGSSSNTGTLAEQIVFNTATAGTYYVRVNGFNSTSAANYNFSAGTAGAASTAAKLTVSSLSQGNNNGTTTLITNSSASSGYTGASGTYNAAASARTGALNTAASGSAYFEFTVTPAAGNAVTLTGISFGVRSTSTGPLNYALRSSLDGYANNIASGTISNNSTWALKSNTGLSVTSGLGTPVTFRIYGFGGTGTAAAGTANWRVDDISLTGSVSGFNSGQCYTLTANTGSTVFRTIQNNIGNEPSISMYPNPVKNFLHVEYNSTKDVKTFVKVTDITGRILINRTQPVLKGRNRMLLNTQSLNKGIYIVSLMIDDQVITRKFIVE